MYRASELVSVGLEQRILKLKFETRCLCFKANLTLRYLILSK